MIFQICFFQQQIEKIAIAENIFYTQDKVIWTQYYIKCSVIIVNIKTCTVLKHIQIYFKWRLYNA